jgi:D-hexose-6-phosphate mutarotase
MPATTCLEHGLEAVRITNRFGSALVYRLGAHVASWCPVGHDDDVLWMSGSSHFALGRPIRGGVPVCFPWFGAHPAHPKLPHGFARLLPWTLSGCHDDADGGTTAVFTLSDDARTRGWWPHAFRLTLTVRVGPVLDLQLDLEAPRGGLTAQAALHTYLAVSDIRRAYVTGLAGAPMIDRLTGDTLPPAADRAAAVRFTGEVDRIYHSAAPMVLHDPGRRTITVAKRGSQRSVVWNPWVAKAARMPDFGNHEWPQMVCLEAARIRADALHVARGGRDGFATVISV